MLAEEPASQMSSGVKSVDQIRAERKHEPLEGRSRPSEPLSAHNKSKPSSTTLDHVAAFDAGRFKAEQQQSSRKEAQSNAMPSAVNDGGARKMDREHAVMRAEQQHNVNVIYGKPGLQNNPSLLQTHPADSWYKHLGEENKRKQARGEDSGLAAADLVSARSPAISKL